MLKKKEYSEFYISFQKERKMILKDMIYVYHFKICLYHTNADLKSREAESNKAAKKGAKDPLITNR